MKFSLRSSLAAKVILSTVVLSVVVVSLAGSALNSRLVSGIRKVNLDASLTESRSTLFSAQYQLLMMTGQNRSKVQKALDDIASSFSSSAADQNRRDIVILPLTGEAGTPGRYQSGLYLLDMNSIPQNIRDHVKVSDEMVYSYGKPRYLGLRAEPALIVAEHISIPKAQPHVIYLLFSQKSTNATIGLIKNSLIATGIFLIILITLITWLVVRSVVQPVRQAALVAKKFTEGDFKERMVVESQDEIATLGEAFNEMALSIENQISRLENLSRVQQRFVSDVSHELRTPLTTLRMASEVVNSARENFDPTIARSVELLVAQLDRFEKLLEDLLEISRFDAEVAVLEAVDFDIVAMVKRTIEENGSRDISLVNAPESFIVKADPRRVERILRNLLDNAVDHGEGEPIHVAIVGSDHEVAVSVRDYGVGMDEESLLRVFDRFWRADPSRARTRGGTGLGLSIALEDARLHNGELEAWGRPGKGAHFVLTLPKVAGESIERRIIPLNPEATFHSNEATLNL